MIYDEIVNKDKTNRRINSNIKFDDWKQERHDFENAFILDKNKKKD